MIQAQMFKPRPCKVSPPFEAQVDVLSSVGRHVVGPSTAKNAFIHFLGDLAIDVQTDSFGACKRKRSWRPANVQQCAGAVKRDSFNLGQVKRLPAKCGDQPQYQANRKAEKKHADNWKVERHSRPFDYDVPRQPKEPPTLRKEKRQEPQPHK